MSENSKFRLYDVKTSLDSMLLAILSIPVVIFGVVPFLLTVLP